jgi:hypothetical protein
MNRTAVGLTRQSIFLEWKCFPKMDTRVKPAYDESLIAIAGISRQLGLVRPRVRNSVDCDHHIRALITA